MISLLGQQKKKISSLNGLASIVELSAVRHLYVSFETRKKGGLYHCPAVF